MHGHTPSIIKPNDLFFVGRVEGSYRVIWSTGGGGQKGGGQLQGDLEWGQKGGGQLQGDLELGAEGWQWSKEQSSTLLEPSPLTPTLVLTSAWGWGGGGAPRECWTADVEGQQVSGCGCGVRGGEYGVWVWCEEW